MNNQAFDERQMVMRGKAYTLGFFSMVFFLMMTPLWKIFFGKELFVNQTALGYFTILVGLAVAFCYLIGNNAFLAVKNLKYLPFYSLFYLLFGAFWLFTSFSNVNKIVVNGQLTDNILFLLGIFWVLTGLSLAYKAFTRS